MKKILSSIFVVALISGLFLATPVFATCPEGTVPASLLGSGENVMTTADGDRCFIVGENGGGINYIIRSVLEIMTIGVGILGVLGITIVGIMYLTAGGDISKTQKAKTRLLEIVIGIAAYAVIGAFIYFLVPNSSMEITVDTPTEAEIIANQKAKEEAEKNAKLEAEAKIKQEAILKGREGQITNETKAEALKRLQERVKKYTWPTWRASGSKGKVCGIKNGEEKCADYGIVKESYESKASYSSKCHNADCGIYVSAMMRGGSKKDAYDWPYNGRGVDGQLNYLKNKKNGWKDVTSLVRNSNGKAIEPGDLLIVVSKNDNRHVALYAGNVFGNGNRIFDASHCNYVGMAAKTQNVIKKMDEMSENHGGNKVYVFRKTFD
ncbi:MAG: hypothetical protein Q4F56_01685 [Candidatus Saccharibacteria bacterium]|nr:hypothetical protein [Candidatus Saccharibacteria bacterium]